MRASDSFSLRGRSIDWGGIAVWLLAFGLVAYLGLEGGGYDQLVHDQVAIATWWAVVAGTLAAALPRRKIGTAGWLAVALFAAFVGWTALSLGWTESVERTWADLARILGYLGALVLALFVQGAGGARRIVGGVAAGIALVGLVALLSRLHPDWFPTATQTAAFLSPGQERLSYPLNYWNGLAALIAVGLPLIAHLASGSKTVLVRALCAATFPALVLALFFTLSRSGIAAAALALALYLLLAADRLPKLLTLLVGGAGGGFLILAADRRESLQDGLLNSTAMSQGDELLTMTIAICLLAAAAQCALAFLLDPARRPRWSRVPFRPALVATGVASLVLVVVLLAFDAPGRTADGWREFKQPSSPGAGTGRLGSAAGQSRYQFWSAAAEQNATRPFTGTGSGTFEFWWNRSGDVEEIVRDTHSLYLQTFGELGIVGLALLVAFLATVLVGGARIGLHGRSDEPRSWAAAALAGCVAFCVTAAFDWMWQLPVLPVTFVLLAAVLLGGIGRERPVGAAPGWPLRIGVAAVGIVAIIAIAIPLSSASLLRQSEADARADELSSALEAARTAARVEPQAATPRLQEALLLERLGRLGMASEAAREATERESTNWRTWLVLSRVEAERGRVRAAVAAYREARSLNPGSSLFAR